MILDMDHFLTRGKGLCTPSLEMRNIQYVPKMINKITRISKSVKDLFLLRSVLS